MKDSVKAHIALSIVSIIYAATFSVAKEVMPNYLSPRAFVLFRIGGALLIFWTIGSLIVREKVAHKDLIQLALLATCGVAFNQLLFFVGLNLTSPINGAIIMTSNPIFVLIIAAILLKDKITITKTLGILLGITGALVLLLINKNFSFGSDTLIGDSIIIINSLLWALFVVLVKPLMKKYNAFTVVKWVFLFGFIYVFPFCYKDALVVAWNDIPLNVWGSIAFIVIGSTFLTYTLNTFSLKYLSPTTMSSYIYFQPFLATLIAIFIFQNDYLDLKKATAGLLILLGVYLVSKPAKNT